jgi:hypothetical protein
VGAGYGEYFWGYEEVFRKVEVVVIFSPPLFIVYLSLAANAAVQLLLR